MLAYNVTINFQDIQKFTKLKENILSKDEQFCLKGIWSMYQLEKILKKLNFS